MITVALTLSALYTFISSIIIFQLDFRAFSAIFHFYWGCELCWVCGNGGYQVQDIRADLFNGINYGVQVVIALFWGQEVRIAFD